VHLLFPPSRNLLFVVIEERWVHLLLSRLLLLDRLCPLEDAPEQEWIEET